MKKTISDMMAKKAAFVLFCDQFFLVLPGNKAMVAGEESCLRLGSLHLVALALESIYIEVHKVGTALLFINQSSFASHWLYDDSRFDVAAFYYGLRIVKRIALYNTFFFNQSTKFLFALIQEAFKSKYPNINQIKNLSKLLATKLRTIRALCLDLQI